MLQPSEFAVGLARALGELGIDQAVARGHLQERDVSQVGGQIAAAVRVREHQELHRELDVDHAAAVVLEVEQAAGVRMRGVQLFAHRDDLLR